MMMSQPATVLSMCIWCRLGLTFSVSMAICENSFSARANAFFRQQTSDHKKKEINKAQSLQQTFEREVIENCTDKWRRMLSHIEKWPHSPPATLRLSHAINWRVRHGRHTPAIYWEPIKNRAYTKRIMLTFFSGSNMFVNLLTDERVAVLETPLNLNAMQYCYKRQCCEW